VRRDLDVVAQVVVGVVVAAEVIEGVAEPEMSHRVAALQAAAPRPCRLLEVGLVERRGVVEQESG